MEPVTTYTTSPWLIREQVWLVRFQARMTRSVTKLRVAIAVSQRLMRAHGAA